MIWCAASWHLKSRHELVGWDPVTRSKRLKLVAQRHRLLVVDKTRRPNLASQCLEMGMGELQRQWHRQYEYKPLLAASFSDPESHAGTVDKVTNWSAAATSGGWADGRAAADKDR